MRQLSEIIIYVRGFSFAKIHTRYSCCKGLNCLMKLLQQRRNRLCLWGLNAATATQLLQDAFNRLHRINGIISQHCCNETGVITRETLAQPVIKNFLERKIGFTTIQYCRARIYIGLYRIRLDQPLTKAVNRCASNFVDRLIC